MGSDMTARTLGYSERGLVNVIVRAVDRTPSLVQALVSKIKWLGDGVAEVLAGQLAHVTSVDLLVEPGFAQFGNPDLVLVVRSGAEQPIVLFLEAKVIRYEKSAIPNDRGIPEDGFNSSINGQLALRYRLACAVAAYNGGDLAEPLELFEAAREHLKDPSKQARRLAKAANVDRYVNLLRQGAGHEFLEHCYFVAITIDTSLPEGLRQGATSPRYVGSAADADRATRQTGWLNLALARTCLSSTADQADWDHCWSMLDGIDPEGGEDPDLVSDEVTTTATKFAAKYTLGVRRQGGRLVLSRGGRAVARLAWDGRAGQVLIAFRIRETSRSYGETRHLGAMGDEDLVRGFAAWE